MVRFAVVGTNFITDNFIKASKFCDGFALTAVHSRSEERAKEYAKQWSIPLIFTDLDALAASDEVDAVYIATPNFTHYEYAVKMMQAGKHVLVEKSITANAREFEKMQAIAAEHGVVMLEALRSSFNPDFLMVKDALEKLGTIRRAIFSCCSYSRRYDNFKAGIIENAFVPEMANGALMDLGVYTVNFMVGLFGAPNAIQANCIKLHNGLDAVGTITAGYDDMMATLFYGKVAASYNHNEIQGEHGYMTIENLNNPQKATIRYNDGIEEVLPIAATPMGTDLQYEIQHFIKFVEANNGQEAVHNRRSLISMQVMDEARRQMDMHFPNDDKK